MLVCLRSTEEKAQDFKKKLADALVHHKKLLGEQSAP